MRYLSNESLQQLSFERKVISLTIMLLCVGKNVHQETKMRYLSNDSLQQLSLERKVISLTIMLLSVGRNVHQETKMRYLSNDSFRSSTTFNREDCPFQQT